MAAKYLKLERHEADEITKDLYLIYLENEAALDDFMRRFFLINRITYNFMRCLWVFRKMLRRRRK